MRARFIAFLSGLLALLLATPVRAQEEGLVLQLTRDWGYGGGKDIQGLFSLKASGPDDLRRVEFYLDETLLFTDTEPPFRFQFNTDNYPLGEHTLYAIGYTADGRQLHSRRIQVNFVTPETGWKTVGKIVGPILAFVVLAMLITTVAPFLGSSRKATLPAGAPRTYPLGGGICPRCQRPFAFHLWGLNLLGGKFDRCPYCGRWSLVRRRSLEELRAAERAELANAMTPPAESEEERLKRALDDSRYQNL